jgi:hypothetical protein
VIGRAKRVQGDSVLVQYAVEDKRDSPSLRGSPDMPRAATRDPVV